MVLQLASPAFLRHAGLQATVNVKVMDLAIALLSVFDAQARPEFNHSGQTHRHHTDDRESLIIEEERLADDRRCPAKAHAAHQ